MPDPAPPDLPRLHEAVAPLCPGVPDAEIRDFLLRVGAAYLAREPIARVAAHVRMAAQLSTARAARVDVSPAGGGLYDVDVVGARAAGIEAVLLVRDAAQPGPECRRVDSLVALADDLLTGGRT